VGRQGQTPVVRSTDSVVRKHDFGGERRGSLRFMLTKGRVNWRRVVEFLKRLMHKRLPCPIFLILDGAVIIGGQLVKDYVGSLGGKLRLFLSARTPPELNPDEQVWNFVKPPRRGRRSRARKKLKNYVKARLQIPCAAYPGPFACSSHAAYSYAPSDPYFHVYIL